MDPIRVDVALGDSITVSEDQTEVGITLLEVTGWGGSAGVTDSIAVALRKYDVPALIRVLWQYTPDKERLLALLEKEI